MPDCTRCGSNHGFEWLSGIETQLCRIATSLEESRKWTHEHHAIVKVLAERPCEKDPRIGLSYLLKGEGCGACPTCISRKLTV